MEPHPWPRPMISARRSTIDTIFGDPRLHEVERHGTAFWIETKASG